jgi:cell division protease FtsH
LNQLDGNAPNNGIFVLASTNRPNLLDKALANRPGRFDIKLEVKLPDATDREKLVRLFSQDKTFDKDVSLQTIVSKTEGFTGAHIQEIFSYAALDSLKKGHPAIKQASLEKALERLRPKQTNVMSQ